MADHNDDVQRSRAFGSERYLVRQIPIAVFLLVAGLASLALPSRWPQSVDTIMTAVLIGGSSAYIAYAWWRSFKPGQPRLVLSVSGIDQRLSHGRILHIPWDEIQNVKSVDQTLEHDSF